MTALVWCPFPDRAAAERAAQTLLDERVVACANLVEGVTALFLWQGERGAGEECGALFKTDAARLDQAVERIAQLHPYDTPAVLGWRCHAAPAATRGWLARETGVDPAQ